MNLDAIPADWAVISLPHVSPSDLLGLPLPGAHAAPPKWLVNSPVVVFLGLMEADSDVRATVLDLARKHAHILVQHVLPH